MLIHTILNATLNKKDLAKKNNSFTQNLLDDSKIIYTLPRNEAELLPN
jgi:hypothetical protein